MLTHPTYSHLVALGLYGMAKALEEQRRQPEITALDLRSGSHSWSIVRPPSARTSAS